MTCNSNKISKITWHKLILLIIVVFAVICIMLSAKPVYATEEVASGTCGDNLTWVLDDEGTLTISGEGEMTSWSYDTKAPWYNNHHNIIKAVIDNGVTSIGDYALYGCSSLTSITIPDSVTSIGEWAFLSCSNLHKIDISGISSYLNIQYGDDGSSHPTTYGAILYLNDEPITDIIIPKDITHIPGYAFYGCSSLSSINIPEGVSSIGFKSFSGCSNLTSITIPEGVTNIGLCAFSNCSSLTSITIPESVTSIGVEAFFNCSSLTSITIPEGVTSIGERAFIECTSLASIAIPEGVTCIENGTFEGCSSLTSITIPEGVTRIGRNAFNNCSSLTSIMIPNGVTIIDDRAFYNCSSLTNITIPDSLNNIGIEVFTNCSSLHKLHISNISSYLNIQYGDDGYSHPTIYGAILYINDEPITDIVIPKGITHIPEYAFYGCSSLTNITIRARVKSIGDYSFDGCSSLTSITIPDSVTNIGRYAFAYCSNLHEIYISNISSYLNIQYGDDGYSHPNYYGAVLYLNDELITDIVITEEITNIPDNAFNGCTSLTSITIQAGVKSIGDYSFDGCSNLTSITIPEGVTSIGKWAFNGCSSLTSITIPEGITIIDDRTFYNCSSLTSIVIPESVNVIGSNTFYNCSSLHKVYISNILSYLNIQYRQYGSDQYGNSDYSPPTKYGAVIYINGEPITDIIIPEGVTRIPEIAFYGCSSLTSITIPESVTSIGKGAFIDCTSLTSIAIPERVTYIERGTFEHCSSLTSVTIPESITGIGGSAFDGCSSLTSIAIPESVTSIEDYTFCNCSSLTSIAIPESVMSIGRYAFENCSNLHEIYISNISSYLNIQYAEVYSRPAIYGATLYINDEPITDIVIPKGITHIPEYAFYGCSSLTSITIPEEVTSIGNNAFRDCNRLTSITIPEGVTSIGGSAFENCSSLTSITIPESVTSIGNRAFYGCSSLTGITIPKGVTSIGDNAFSKIADNYIAYVFPGSYADRYFLGDHKRYLYTEETDTQKYISFKYDKIILKTGEIITVSDFYDTNIAYSNITVTIEDDSLFMYDDGKIAALGEGETYLVLSDGEVSERIGLICTSEIAKIIGLSLKDDVLELKKGETIIEQISFAPDNAAGKEVTWSSSNTSVVIVNDGRIEAIGSGTAMITVALTDDSTIFDTCEVIVINPLKAIVTFDESFYRIKRGNTQKIGYYIYPYDADDLEINFSSSDPDTISIDENGYMTAHKNGTADITISSGEFSETVTVTVFTPLKGISLDKNSVQLKCEEQIQLDVIFDPEDTTERDVIWTSSKESVISVDENGLITPKGKGIATITATAGKYTATCNIVSKWHTEEVFEAIAPTCTEAGFTEGRKCSECGEILIAQEEIPALGHDLIHHEAKEPTCEEVGWDAYDACSRCDYKTYSEIPATGHTPVTDPAISPTCTETGLTEGSHCSVCGNILVAQEIIPATGHSWGEPTYTWSDDNNNVTAERVCVNDPLHVESETVGTSYTEITPATETVAGIGRYTSEAFANEAFTVQTKDVGLPPIGFEVSYEWSLDNTKVTGIAVPYNTSADTITETVDAIYTVTKEPTCTDKGTGIWTSVSFTNDLFTVQTKEVELEALGHDLIHHEAKEPTCEEVGWNAYDTCSRCDYTTYAGIPATGHTPGEAVVENEVAATCLEVGSFDEVIYCSSCNKELSRNKKTIPALGHDLIHHETKAPTCEEVGWEAYDTCSRCDYTTYEEIAALGHDFINHESKAATCTEPGWDEYDTCSRCEYTTYEGIAPLGHDYTSVITKATLTADGSIQSKCSRCGMEDPEFKPIVISHPATFTLSTTSYTYTGGAKKPSVTIEDADGNTISAANYSVAYSNNIKVGTATAKVTFKGEKYSGTKSLTFKITPKALSKTTISLSATSYTYDGSVKKPTVTVKDTVLSKTVTLVSGTDYTVTYASGRKNVGSYKITIKGKGNYTGTVTKTFKINPKGTTLKTLTATSKGFKATWTKQSTKMSTSYITGYQIQYSTSSTFASGNKTVTATKYSTVSKTISKLTAKKKYYVRIRTYKTVNGVKYYSPWSAKKYVTTKA